MHATQEEVVAARRLAEALVEFLAVRDQAFIKRKSEHPGEDLAVDVKCPAASSISAIAESLVCASIQKTPSPEKIGSNESSNRHLLTVKEAAEFLSISRRHLASLSAPNGPIPVVKIGRAVRYSTKDLQATIDIATKRPPKPRKGGIVDHRLGQQYRPLERPSD